MDINQFTVSNGVTTRRLRLRDLSVEVVPASAGAAALLDETFYPPGMLNVRTGTRATARTSSSSARGRSTATWRSTWWRSRTAQAVKDVLAAVENDKSA
ncbi:hypothetical protein [Kutzneria sp. NPDC052558]|uniref:hypothetical protein n=1 Tax=Kutzneria sp. NPDC052558 TaxID=3364121 RepID=UPI0037C8073F